MAIILRNDFNGFEVSYGITNPLGKDLARITFLNDGAVVGQALFGDAITPGSFAAIHAEKQIHLYLPMVHFANVFALLSSGKTLALFVESLGPSPAVSGGGILAA